MTAIAAGARTWRRRDRRTQLLVWAAWLFAVALFVGCFQLISDKTIWAFVWDAPQQAGDLAVRMVPPDWLYIRVLGRPIWDTINIQASAWCGRSLCSSSYRRARSMR
jgi:phosphonate transport system permease protein